MCGCSALFCCRALTLTLLDRQQTGQLNRPRTPRDAYRAVSASFSTETTGASLQAQPVSWRLLDLQRASCPQQTEPGLTNTRKLPISVVLGCGRGRVDPQTESMLTDDHYDTSGRRTSQQLTLIKLDAARMLMRATDSLLRRGNRLYPERWLVKELSEVTPGVMGPPGAMWGVLGERPSISSGQRKARPRARGSTICQNTLELRSEVCTIKQYRLNPKGVAVMARF